MSGPPETFMLEAGAVAAAYALADGKTVIARWDTPDEAWATREDVPRCGTVYVVKGPRPTDDDEGDPRAYDTPEQAINDLAQRRAPAPKPAHLCPKCDRKRRDCTCYGIFGDLPKREDVIPLPSEPEPFHGRVTNCHLCRDCPCALDPEPDELTVDDVLGVLGIVLSDDTWQLPGGGWVGRLDGAEGGFALWYPNGDTSPGCAGFGQDVGTLAAMVQSAKRRGLLG